MSRCNVGYGLKEWTAKLLPSAVHQAMDGIPTRAGCISIVRRTHFHPLPEIVFYIENEMLAFTCLSRLIGKDEKEGVSKQKIAIILL